MGRKSVKRKNSPMGRLREASRLGRKLGKREKFLNRKVERSKEVGEKIGETERSKLIGEKIRKQKDSPNLENGERKDS